MSQWYEPYDSPEEAYVSWYLDELVEADYVLDYQAQPKSFTLSPKRTFKWTEKLKTKEKDRVSTLLQEHVYTADFSVKWGDTGGVFIKNVNNTRLDRDAPFLSGPSGVSIIEVKPSFDRNNMTRLFIINQKWMYDKYGIYVHKVIPQKLFEATFTPKKYLLTDTGKQKRKIKFATRTLEEYVRSRTT